MATRLTDVQRLQIIEAETRNLRLAMMNSKRNPISREAISEKITSIQSHLSFMRGEYSMMRQLEDS
jgi:hypothetical protein